MESILRWSLQHSAPLDPAARESPASVQQKIDPEIIDMILGKPDAQLMKEDMVVATDVSKSEDDRFAALDHLEMLVEQIDNANDLEKLKLWDPLLSMLTSNDSSMDIKVQVLWIIGTALQNNPSAQDACLSRNPLPTIFSFLTPSSSSSLAARSKALYALSGLLKHNAPAVVALGNPDIDGWAKLRDALRDPDISVRKKAAFLLNALLTPMDPHQVSDLHDPLHYIDTQVSSSSTSSIPALHTPDELNSSGANPIHPNSHAAHLRDPNRSDTSLTTRAAFERYGIMDAATSSLPASLSRQSENERDADFEEKIIRLLYTYAVTCDGRLKENQRALFRNWIEREKQSNDWGLSPSEFDVLIQRLV